MPNVPCNKVPIKFVNCCQVMDCINIQSSDNSITVEVSDCGVDLTQTGNNLDQILKINNGTCITFTKEFIDGVLHITPILNMACIAASVCDICGNVTCPAPLTLTVSTITVENDLILINSSDSLLIDGTDILNL